MEDQPAAAPIPFAILIIGLIVVAGCAIWAGSVFFLYGGGLLYGVAAGISIGAAYACGKQIKIRLASKQSDQR